MTKDNFKIMWCPACNRKGLNAYNEKGEGTGMIQKVSEIDHLWCLHCGFTITSKAKRR